MQVNYVQTYLNIFKNASAKHTSVRSQRRTCLSSHVLSGFFYRIFRRKQCRSNYINKNPGPMSILTSNGNLFQKWYAFESIFQKGMHNMTKQLKFLGLVPSVSREFLTPTLLEAIATTTATRNSPFLHPQTKNYRCRCFFHLPTIFVGDFQRKKSTESGRIPVPHWHRANGTDQAGISIPWM